MSLSQQGGCLCGDARYAIDPDAAVMTSHCHCRDCQRSTGSGFATFVAVPPDAFELRSGDLGHFEVTGESGGQVDRFFCKRCGSQLFSQVTVMPGFRFVKAGTLDDASWVKPAAAFWGDTAWPWAPPAAGVTLHARNPG